MKSIREIYESFEHQDETILFQVKKRSTLNKMLEEFKEIDKWVYWDKYKEISLEHIYLCVGSWRLGMAGIFPSSMIDNDGDYCFDHFCIDWKASPSIQYDQKRQVNKFIEIMDKYRSDIKVSRKKYHDFE